MIKIVGARTEEGRAEQARGDRQAKRTPTKPEKRRRRYAGASRCTLFYMHDATTPTAVHTAVKRLITALDKAGYDTTKIECRVPKSRSVRKK